MLPSGDVLLRTESQDGGRKWQATDGVSVPQHKRLQSPHTDAINLQADMGNVQGMVGPFQA